MKNQRSVGEDGLNAEFDNYGSSDINLNIATLLNKMAETGKHPDKMKKGIPNTTTKTRQKNWTHNTSMPNHSVISHKKNTSNMRNMCMLESPKLQNPIIPGSLSRGSTHHRIGFCSENTSRKNHNLKYISHLVAFTWHE